MLKFQFASLKPEIDSIDVRKLLVKPDNIAS